MPLRLFARGAVRSATAVRSSQQLMQLQPSNRCTNNRFVPRSSSTSTNAADQPLRRRRRRGAGGSTSIDKTPDDTSTINTATTSSSSNIIGTSDAAFAPKDTQGNLLDAQEYLKLASLSPWVPCPDMVIKRVFEIAEATSDDVHVDLGCGDGRLCFAAVGGPNHVKRSWGVDVDHNILEKCRERLERRFVPTGLSVGGNANDENNTNEADRLEFVQADLIRVVDRQKGIHRQQQYADDESFNHKEEDRSKEDEITRKLSQSTVVTMYFVDDALQQLQSYLASTLGGKENVRVITVGYEMKGWDATWVERVLGLTIFKYDMVNVSNEPLEWSVGGEDESASNGTVATSESLNYDAEYAGVDESPELAEFLKQKREQDMEELNNGLRIHHDEELNDFAQSRSMRQLQDSGSQQNIAAATDGGSDDWEDDDDDWDFDETEDPEELLKDARRIMAEARTGGKGKGMMAGLDSSDKKGIGTKDGVRAKPVWKKP